jgi:hypothetical protein
VSGAFDQQVDDLVTRTHGEGIRDLAAAALSERSGRFLLIEKPVPDFDTIAFSGVLPTIPVRAGETVTAALERGLVSVLVVEIEELLGEGFTADGSAVL